MAASSDDELRDGESIDREIRINELRCKAEELAGGNMLAYESDETPPEIAEGFWSNVVGYETAPDTTQHEMLRSEGVELPPPESLNDADLTEKLWEVIHSLAARNTYLHNTDHLSDRELYTVLVNELFHEVGKEFPAGSGWNHHFDILGGCSDEDIELGHRYYSDDEERARWMESFPDYKMPPKEKPPFDRDRLLPRSEFG
jgi:hypothetical protein